MHRCLFILFGFIFTYRWLQCIHQLSYAFQWLLFDHLFDIYYCVYINSKLLISPTDSEGWGLCRGQQALLVHCGGTWPASCPQLPQPQDTPALVHKPSRLQGWDTSPDRYGLRGIESAFLLPYFSVFTLWFKLEYIGELQFCGAFFAFQSNATWFSWWPEVSFLNLSGCVSLGKNCICIHFWIIPSVV